jgi:choloylglycine hydrolase
MNILSNLVGYLQNRVSFQSGPKKGKNSFACTDFAITTKNGKRIASRSMEFPESMKSVISFHAQGETKTSTAPGPGNPSGLSWTSKYGYVSIGVFGQDDAVDGLNQEGLTCGFLTLQCSQYQTVPSGQNSQALELMDVGSWILGNFATCDEVAAAIKNVFVWGKIFPPLNSIPGLHIAVHDKSGNNIVIEYIEGQPIIMQNPIGVLTNDPPFLWHQINLSNYNGVSAQQTPDIVINGVQIPSAGPGSGLFSLPGGLDSISRFTKIAKIIQFIMPSQTALKGVNECVHILNHVDKPAGLCLAPFGSETVTDLTRWSVYKNLTDGDFYFTSYENLVLKVIHLGKMNLSPGQKYPDISVAGDGEEFSINVTPKTTS